MRYMQGSAKVLQARAEEGGEHELQVVARCPDVLEPLQAGRRMSQRALLSRHGRRTAEGPILDCVFASLTGGVQGAAVQ
jgi:hypothetical protein